MKRTFFSTILTTSLLVLFCLSAAAQQPPTVAPGQSIQFTTPTNGDIVRSEDKRISAAIDASGYTIRASAGSAVATSVSSWAFLYNEFKVTGDVPRTVSAQISANAKYNGQIVVGGFGGASASADVALTLLDVTAGFRQVAGTQIVNAKASQPIAITPGGSTQNESGDRAVGFQATLVRGHTYRLLFRIDCAADGTAGAGASDFHAGEKLAKLSNLSVQIGEDTAELLEIIRAKVFKIEDDIATIQNSVDTINSKLDARLDVAVSTRASQVSVNQVQSTVNIINQKADEILAKLMDFQRDALRAEIEAALVEGDRYNVAWYQMPKDAGGHLELVRGIVADSIETCKKAGMPATSGTSISQAAGALATGDQYYAAKGYKDAYDYYRSAYLHLSIVPGAHRP